MSRQPKVAVYARVSTGEQSPDAQLRDLREYIRNRGWELVTEFIDVGESGSKDVRPAWSELWTQLRQRKFNVLVVWAIDRIGRSLPHLVKILAAIEEHNVTLVSLREAFDLSTAQGRMLAGLFAVLADYELSLIKERTKAGMRARGAKGRQIGPRSALRQVTDWGDARPRPRCCVSNCITARKGLGGPTPIDGLRLIARHQRSLRSWAMLGVVRRPGSAAIPQLIGRPGDQAPTCSSRGVPALCG
jgi:DNA invertase Pin-like site-specific DNA recombinase